MTFGSLGCIIIDGYIREKIIANLKKVLPDIFEHELPVKMYTDDHESLDRQRMQMISACAYVRSIFTPIEHYIESIQDLAKSSINLSNLAVQDMMMLDCKTCSIASSSASLPSSLEDLHCNVSNAANYALDANTMAQNTLAIAMQSKANFDNIEASSGRIEASIGEVSQPAAKINEMLQSIKDIAKKINLLSLNAAIEADRAGQFCCGFAVVADEVNALSGKTDADAQ